MTEQEIIDDLLKTGILGRTQIQKKFGVSEHQARKISHIAEYLSNDESYQHPEFKHENKKTETKPQKIGISEKELRMRHDNFFILTQKVKELKRDNFLTTPEFIQSAKIKMNNGYKQLLEHPDFTPFCGKAGSVTYWGHPEDIARLKEDGTLT